MAAEEELGHKITEHTLSITNEQTIEMYHGSKILSTEVYKGGLSITLYALSNTVSGKGFRKIFIYETNEIIDTKKDKTYIATVSFTGKAYHIFEEK